MVIRLIKLKNWIPTRQNVVCYRCIKKGHKPVVVNFGKGRVVFHCEVCRKLYRADVGKVSYVDDGDWLRQLPS